jgi:hypothetical protein
MAAYKLSNSATDSLLLLVGLVAYDRGSMNRNSRCFRPKNPLLIPPSSNALLIVIIELKGMKNFGLGGYNSMYIYIHMLLKSSIIIPCGSEYQPTPYF